MIKSNNTKLINGGCFPKVKAFPEDELKLLSDENNFLVTEPDLPEPIDVDCVSQSSSSLRGWYMSNHWDMMSSESSWNLDNDKLWQKTFHSKSHGTTSKFRSSNGGEEKKKFYTPSKAPRRLNESRKNTSPKIAQQSPLTTATSQTASTAHSSPLLTNLPSPQRISKELVLPELKDEKNFDLSSYRSDSGDVFSFDDSSVCSDGPPKARRLFAKEHHQNNNEKEEKEGKTETMTSTVSTKEIINLFFPPMEITEGDEDERSNNGSNNDEISYNSQSLSHRESFASFLSRDSSFEKLFNSSMASI
jgi:hypothetical protein